MEGDAERVNEGGENVTEHVCDVCSVRMVVGRATRTEPYQYRASGLSNVFLSGITVFTCPNCGGRAPVIPRIEELHAVITRILLDKAGLLTGEEIRFLRKNAGLSSKQFAESIRVTPAHLSRVENGRPGYKHFHRSTDQFARTVVKLLVDEQDAREFVLRQEEKARIARRRMLRLGTKGWAESKVA